MRYYIDVTLLPDSEVNFGFLWHKVFQQIHIALAENKLPTGESAIALSFPYYKSEHFPLGNTLRVLAPEDILLKKLRIDHWLVRFQDYLAVSSIKEVPSIVDYVRFSQKRVKGKTRLDNSLRKKAQHIHEKFGTDFGQTLNDLRHKSSFEESKLPFVNVESQSKAQDGRKPRFKLFIERHECANPEQGEFDCYGLSKTATVPWF